MWVGSGESKAEKVKKARLDGWLDGAMDRRRDSAGCRLVCMRPKNLKRVGVRDSLAEWRCQTALSNGDL